MANPATCVTHVHRSREFRTTSLGDHVNSRVTWMRSPGDDVGESRRGRSSMATGRLGDAVTASNRLYDGSVHVNRAKRTTVYGATLGPGGDISFVHNDVYVKYHDRHAAATAAYVHTPREKLRLYIIRQVDG